jgi:hypothetical protein
MKEKELAKLHQEEASESAGSWVFPVPVANLPKTAEEKAEKADVGEGEDAGAEEFVVDEENAEEDWAGPKDTTNSEMANEEEEGGGDDEDMGYDLFD